MDKKPGEELASTLDANPSEPIAPAAPATPVAEPAPAAPVADPAPVAGPAPIAAAPAAPTKKKKTGLIIGATIGTLALVGGGTAAAIILLNNGKSTSPEDAASAINDTIVSALSGELTSSAKNVAFDGSIKLSAGAYGSGEIKLTGESNGLDKAKANASISANISGMDFSASADAVVTSSAIYFKPEISSLLENAYFSMMFSQYGALKNISGNWYKLPISTSVDMVDSYAKSNSKCSFNTEKLLKDRSGLANLYKENAFVVVEKYTGNAVSKKKSDLYEISIDGAKLQSFAEALNSKYVTAASGYKCSVDQIDTSALDKLKESGFVLLAEFDGGSVSRVYGSYADSTSGASYVADFSFTYPGSVSIEEPSNAKDFNDIVSSFGGGSYERACSNSLYDTNCLDYDDDDDDDDDDYDYSSLFDDDDDFDYKSLFDEDDYEELLQLLQDMDIDIDDLSDLDESDYSQLLERYIQM